MRTELNPYPAMKDSGIEWLGEVPEHWEVRRTKNVLRERGEKGFPDEPMLAATQTKGVVRKGQYENRTVLALKDLHLLKLVRVGDFVISLRSFQGGIEYAREQGIISPAYTVLHVQDPDNHDFLAHLFKSKPYIENLGLFVTGIRQGQNIDYEKLGRSRLPLPSLLEQSAIVRYLDHVDRRVRRLVRAKRKLIALLTEQKQAIIHRAVTRGLDPDVPVKDSGAEWLGEVPEHWEVVPIKRLLSHMDYGTSEAAKADGHIRVLTMANIQEGEVVPAGSGGLSAVPKGLLLKRHDLLFTRTNGNPRLVGKVGIFRGSAADEVTFASYLVRLRVPSDTDPCWLHLLLNSAQFWGFARSHALVNLQTNLNSTRYGLFKIPVPPPLEQRGIVEWVERETHQLADTASSTIREIELLNEYRTRLIADVVTGKLDVGDRAASLPEVDPLTADEPDEVLDTDAEVNLDELDAIPEEAEV